MQILQWLFNKKEQCTKEVEVEEEEGVVKSREVVVCNNQFGEILQSNCNTFSVLLKREDSRECFYSTLQLSHLKRLDGWRWSSDSLVGMGRQKGDPAVSVGCMVLPKCDLASRGRMSCDDEFEQPEKGGGATARKGERRKAMSRMKELIRWAAAAKSHKSGRYWKVLYFRNKLAIKDPLDDASSNSSKISFRWDVGSCSASSSVYSPLSVASAPPRNDQIWTKNHSNSASNLKNSDNTTNMVESLKTEGCSRFGQWITSDSDFVVLEL